MDGTIYQGDERFRDGDGNVYHFMFPERGGALQGSSASPWAPKSVTGERDYSNYDVFSAVAFSDLSGGMGQERAKNPAQYYTAFNADARGGKLVLGPEQHLTSSPGLAAGRDYMMQMWNGRAATTSDYFTFLPVGYEYQPPPFDSEQSTLAARWTAPNDCNKIDRVWLVLRTTLDAANDQIQISVIGDDNGLPDESEVLGEQVWKRPGSATVVGGWTEITFDTPVVVVPGATYWFKLQHSGPLAGCGWLAWTAAPANNVARDTGDGWYLPGTPTELLLWAEDSAARPSRPPRLLFGSGKDGIDRVWLYAGRRLYYVNAQSNTVVVGDARTAGTRYYELGADIAGCVWFQGTPDTTPFLYVAMGESVDAQKYNADLTGTPAWTAIAGVKATHLVVHHQWLVRVTSRNEVSVSTDGATFSAAVPVGDKTNPIRKIISWNGDVYAGTDDALYKVEVSVTDLVVTKVIDFSAQADRTNFFVMVEHQQDLIFSLGQGLMRFTSGNVLTSITPETGLMLPAGARSRYTAATSSLNALWVAAESPGDAANVTSILTYSEGRWHPVITVARAGDMIRSLLIEPGLYGPQPRLWYGCGLQLGYILMPTTTQRRWLWDGMDYAPFGELLTSWIDGNILTIPKNWVCAEVYATIPGEGNGTPARVSVAWRTDENSPWCNQEADVRTTGVTRLALGGASNKLQLAIQLHRGDNAGTPTTPVVEAVVVKYLERPQDLKAFTRTYELSSNASYSSGLPVGLSLAEQLQQLETLREQRTPLTWYPWFGGSYKVHVSNYSFSEVRERVDREGIRAAGSINVSVSLVVLE